MSGLLPAPPPEPPPPAPPPLSSPVSAEPRQPEAVAASAIRRSARWVMTAVPLCERRAGRSKNYDGEDANDRARLAFKRDASPVYKVGVWTPAGGRLGGSEVGSSEPSARASRR